MKSRIVAAFVVVSGLALAGAGLRGLERPGERVAAWDETLAAAGGERAFGILGGFRGLAADLVWLRAYAAWERGDAPATETGMRLAAALDPRPLGFWINGARVIAYDVPVWRIAALGGGRDDVPGSVRRRIAEEQAQRAIDFLNRAIRHHPANAAPWVERAMIEANRLHDPTAAAESYRRAAGKPDAPYYVARLHAELLRQLGRKPEALAWLKQVHPTLPPNDRAAEAGLVLTRIRALERELSVPVPAAYRTPRTGGARE